MLHWLITFQFSINSCKYLSEKVFGNLNRKKINALHFCLAIAIATLWKAELKSFALLE